MSVTADEFKSLIKEISNLIDARAKTTEAFLEEKNDASEKKLITHFEKELGEVKEELIDQIWAARAEAKANDLEMKAKIIRILGMHERWLEEIGKVTGVSNPDKN